MERIQISSPTGATLNAYAKDTENPAKAVVQINHGLAEHAARYERFMTALAKAGFASIAHDHRGHGETKAPGVQERQFGKGAAIQDVLSDVKAVHQYCFDRWEGVPHLTFGHSMGGLIALNYAMAYPEDQEALAVWNANAAPGVLGSIAQGVLAIEKSMKASERPSKIIPALTFSAWNKSFSPTRTAFDWLSRDEAEVDAYVKDPQCGWDASIGMWVDIMNMAKAGESDQAVCQLPTDLAVFILGGEKDPATNGGKACAALAKRMRNNGMLNVRLDVVPETRHEALNEVNRDELTSNFVQWAEAALA